MNQKKVKWLRKLVNTKNPVLLLLIRNKYGEETQGMDYGQLFKKAKELYRAGEIQKVKNWPTMEGRIFDNQVSTLRLTMRGTM